MDLDQGVVEGEVHVRKKELHGIVIGESDGSGHMGVVRGYAEGLISAVDGVDKDASQD